MIVLGDDVPVIVERKRIKNIYFKVNEDGNIIVSSPKYVTDREIDKLLNSNIKSLERMYSKFNKRKDKKETVMYLGKELDFIEYKDIMFQDNYAFGPSVKAINEYLEKNALSYFQERLNVYIGYYPNHPDFKLRMRNMKTRWGVNNRSSKTITLNTLLIHHPTSSIDYVICHELSHFKEMNHSARFWKEVERVYPEYSKARKELRD